MNTLVEGPDGQTPAPGTDESPAHATLADNATLIELAPQSGKTLLLDPAGRPPEMASAVPAAPRGGADSSSVEARALLRLQRARVWAPILAGALGLAATAWPLWRRASHTDKDKPVPARSDPTVPAVTRAIPAAPIEPAAVAAEDTIPTAAIQRAATVVEPQGAAPPRRRHARAPSSAHHKPRGPILRTRNGSPVVD